MSAELFYIPRHEDTKEPIVDKEEDEKAKLNEVLKKIEKRKRQRQQEKEKKLQKVSLRKLVAKQKEQQYKKKLIVQVPNNKTDDEFVDESLKPDPGESVVVPKKKKRKLNAEGFTILGAENVKEKAKVKRVLPKWLAQPTVISSNLQELTVKVSGMKELNKSMRKRLKANGIERFFPVQAGVIPHLLKSNRLGSVVFPRDICVSAPTGSGKTLAYVVPIVQALERHMTKRIWALVVLPTRDLALQVFKTFKLYSQGTDIEVRCITGSHSFSDEQKQLGVQSTALGYVCKTDILVCTPGRLVDHLKSTPGFSLQHLEFLVIDEADRLLENVQNDWLYHLEKHIHNDDEHWNPQTGRTVNQLSLQGKRPPQKLLFSATLSQDPEKLQKLLLFQPILFTCTTENTQDNDDDDKETFIGKYTTPMELTEKYVVCSKDVKPLVLYKFIASRSLKKVLVFTHSIEFSHRLKILMQTMFKDDDMKVEEIFSSLKSHKREDFIDRFAKGEVNILICTDTMARGIDLPGVECVVSYSAPKFIKTYIHRAGRTARAGEEGLTLTLLHEEQVPQFKQLLNQAKKTGVEEIQIPESELSELSTLYQKSLAQLNREVKTETKTKLKKVISKKRQVKSKTVKKHVK